jgi:hypothetical protein
VDLYLILLLFAGFVWGLLIWKRTQKLREIECWHFDTEEMLIWEKKLVLNLVSKLSWIAGAENIYQRLILRSATPSCISRIQWFSDPDLRLRHYESFLLPGRKQKSVSRSCLIHLSVIHRTPLKFTNCLSLLDFDINATKTLNWACYSLSFFSFKLIEYLLNNAGDTVVLKVLSSEN